jgi:hypothetical protein
MQNPWPVSVGGPSFVALVAGLPRGFARAVERSLEEALLSPCEDRNMTDTPTWARPLLPEQSAGST